MLIDYLRYVAFRGRLRSFFGDGLYQYVEASDTTGQHLRFAPDFLQSLGDRWYALSRAYRDWNVAWHEVYSRLLYEIGVSGDERGASTQVEHGGPPMTFSYHERQLPPLEIIIDINPGQWAPRYAETGQYENVPILYRRAGPAMGHLSSGDRLFDRSKGPAGHGTLCGFFCSPTGEKYALTCGHVLNGGGEVAIQFRRRFWRIPLWSTSAGLGKLRHLAIPGTKPGTGPPLVQLDAALISVDPVLVRSKSSALARIQPISTELQETPVYFRGAGRITNTLARISAVCVRKSMDLLRDGNLRDVGDVLLLGHPQPMYISQRVSRPGDSGAAVRQSIDAESEDLWHGMVL